MCRFTESKTNLDTCLIQHTLQPYIHLIPPQVHTLNVAEASLVILNISEPSTDV
jgi:hypothetical protein